MFQCLKNTKVFSQHILLKFLFIFLLYFLFFNTDCHQLQTTEQININDVSFLQKPQIQIFQGSMKYSKLLQVERQIIMSQEMIKLYNQRIKVLKQLRNQLNKQMQQLSRQYQNNQQNSVQLDNNQKKNSKLEQNTEKNPFQQSQKQNIKLKNSNLYVLMNQDIYQIQKKKQSLNQKQKGIFNQLQLNDNNFIIIPPFIINKTCVTILNQHFKSLKQNNSSHFFDFGKSSNRILFYEVQNLNQNIKIKNQNFDHQSYVLHLALQIKPNKIKKVKITYSFNFNINNQSFYQEYSDNPKFQIQEQITSYESNQLINNNFKWHKSLQFQDLIIGFRNTSVYIKSKDKKMHEVDIGSKILQLYTLNQYKILFISQKKIGTLNVRSLVLSDEVLIQHYLGNRTVLEQKRRKQQNLQYKSQNYMEFQQNGDSFWKETSFDYFKEIKCISPYYIKKTKQTLILLNNGDLLLYEQQKISNFVNLGSNIKKQFSMNFLTNKFNQDENQLKMHQQNLQHEILKDFSIKLQLLQPNFNHLLLYSNLHSKVLLLNISIPYLTVKSTQGFFSFSPTKANEFNAQYWLPVQLQNKQKVLQQNNIQTNFYKNFGIFVTHKNALIFRKAYKDSYKIIDYQIKDEKHILLMYIFSIKTQKLSIDKQDQKEYIERKILCKFSQFRLILDIFNSKTNLISNSKSQGRNYLWNIFMFGLVIAGVLIFRKCKNMSQEKQKSQQELYFKKNNLGLVNKKMGSQFGVQTSRTVNKGKKLQSGEYQQLNKSKKNEKKYNEGMIAQLQNYLQNQGQKLTKEQVYRLVQNLQQQNEDQERQIKQDNDQRQKEFKKGQNEFKKGQQQLKKGQKELKLKKAQKELKREDGKRKQGNQKEQEKTSKQKKEIVSQGKQRKEGNKRKRQ